MRRLRESDTMNESENNNPLLRDITRRHFFRNCAVGVGSIALASLFAESLSASPTAKPQSAGLPGPPSPPRAKNVIYLFMAGGPSQLELFDYKPKLQELNGEPIPQSFIEGKRFAFMNATHGVKLLGTRKQFKQRGQGGAWISEMLPHTASIADDLCIVN